MKNLILKIQGVSKKRITILHFVGLIFFIVNYNSKYKFDISINQMIIFGIKIVFLISGAFLFFRNIKPFRKISIYFSIYIISPLVVFISWFIDGIMFALLASIFLVFIVPNTKVSENKDFVLYNTFSGFIGNSYHYEIIENKMIFFEKRIGHFRLDEFSNPQIKTITKRDEYWVVKLSLNSKKDTTLYISDIE